MSGWVVMGLIGQGIFGSRFLVQWLVSERQKRSVIPMAFWYLSIVGSVVLLSYAIHRRDPVFIMGECGGIIIYIRNLILLRGAGGESRGSGEASIGA